MILVTGANGFIGSTLAKELNNCGFSDLILSDSAGLDERSDLLKNTKSLHFFSPQDLAQWCNEYNADSKTLQCIFHIGAISSTTETDWSKLVINNIDLPKFLYAFAVRHDIPFIYASSGAVYGNGAYGFKDTESPSQFKPLNLYGRSKQEFDSWILSQNNTLRWAGLRFFNVYGPNEYHKGEMASVVYKAFVQIKSSEKLKLFRSHIPQYKDGGQLRDFVYIKDIVRWLIEIFKNSSFPSGIYNLGFGQARTWLDLAENVFLNMQKPVNIEWIDIPGSIRDQYQYFTEADMKKSFAAGLSQPQYSLESGIRDYLKNYLLTDNPYY